MGSPTFYLEFLSRLRDSLAASHPTLVNCAIFAPSYPLVPDQTYPSQSIAVEYAWKYLARHPGVDSSRLVVMGDSAGAALGTALMSSIAKGTAELQKPHQAM